MRSFKAIGLTCLFLVAAIGIVHFSGCGGGGGGTSSAPSLPPTLQSISLAPVDDSVELGVNTLFTAIGRYSDGSTRNLTTTALWSSTNEAVATVDSTGYVTTKGTGSTTIRATLDSVTGDTTLTVTHPGHFLLKNVGLWTQFERRGWPAEYWPGQVIQDWDRFDPVVGSTVSQEVSLQLDEMKAMGVNTITIELRTADSTDTGSFTPPDCNIPPALGFQFPQPTAAELANLPRFFEMVEGKGMKIWLRLVNTHMEQQPRTDSQMWIGAILEAIGNHPALDLVLFEGTPNVVGDACGTPAEPPLWLGPDSVPAKYIQWAVGFAMSQGFPAWKLSAEAVVGDIFLDSMPPAGSDATDNHLWPPIVVEKMIFDNLNIPANQRTYALSFYEHPKCSTARGIACTDLDPHDWADQTLQYVTSVVDNGPRIVAPEMGNLVPVDPSWKTQYALESIIVLMQKHGVDGGSFWRWASFQDSEDLDQTLADPVKRRGVPFLYNPVQKEIVDMGGFHLPVVPNGSFEGPVGNGIPADWTASGNGTVSRYLLTQEPGQPEVPSRGTHAMRILTGAGASDAMTATSARIPVIAATAYTTTANLRFSWTGDPNPGGPPASRPRVFVDVLYLQENGTPSAFRALDSFSFFQEDSTDGFATFPQRYTTPSDAAFIEIRFGAMRNGLPDPIVLDVDNIR